MPPPFPGMDPYLEDAVVWGDYHTTFLLHLRAEISARLPERYAARLDRYVWIHEADDDEKPVLREPDVFVSDEGGPAASTAVVALNAPSTSMMPAVRRQGHRYLKIVDALGKRVVTVIEILSPSNKTPGDDRDAYLAKRGEYLASGANFVEINLLRGGRQSPMGQPPPPKSDYCVVVSQAAEYPKAGVWPFGLRDPLPTIPIPLTAGDNPIQVDLGVCHEKTCRDGQYGKDIDYSGSPPPPPLSPEDQAWLRELLARKFARS
jgi:Protein of unknown function (DUF4058)